jgi:hypothetical protein
MKIPDGDRALTIFGLIYSGSGSKSSEKASLMPISDCGGSAPKEDSLSIPLSALLFVA